MIKKKFVVLSLSFVLLFSAAFKRDYFEIAKQLEIFTMLFKELNLNYVGEIAPAQLMDSTIKSMLAELDPYTLYMNEQDIEGFRMRGMTHHAGLGAQIKWGEKGIKLIEIQQYAAADKAGLKAGDVLTSIDRIPLEDYDETAIQLLDGPLGSEVEVEYLSAGIRHTATVVRSAFNEKAVPFYGMLNEEVGYIAVQKFITTTTKETRYAIQELKLDGAKSLILDLRGNPGGLLNEAINMVNLFVPKGQLIVTSKSSAEKHNRTYFTQNDPEDTEVPLVVLIDEKSASASEIVSGAIQDLDRGLIMGRRSFGKGLVQRVMKLPYGTQVKITISRYHTPSGRCIQALDYSDRDEHGEAKEIKQHNEYKTLRGRSVFDGGGIDPDVKIADDEKPDFIKMLAEEDHLFDFVTEYIAQYKKPMNVKECTFPNSDFQEFKKYLKRRGYKFQTETEKRIKSVTDIAHQEGFEGLSERAFSEIFEKINKQKAQLVEDHKTSLISLIEGELVKRFFYRRGYYEYQTQKGTLIEKAVEILEEPSRYSSYLGAEDK